MRTPKILAAVVAAFSAAACAAVSASAYTGYIGFQDYAYSFRNKWNEPCYGKDTKYFDKVIIWGGNDPETWPEHADSFDEDIMGYAFDAEYTDVEITSDGTYTVSAEGIDWSIDKASNFNLIFVSTDIPNDGTVTIKEASIIVDGVKAYTTDSFYVSEADEYLSIELVNIWEPEIGTHDIAYPTQSLAVEFTLEGLVAPSADDTSVDDTSVDDTSVDDTSVDDTSVDDTSVDDTSVDDTSVDDTPVDDTSVDDTSVDDTSVDDTSVDDTSVDDTSVDDTSVDDTAGDGTSADDVSAPADDKTNPDTGIAGVAAVAGLAVIAAGAVVISKKRK